LRRVTIDSKQQEMPKKQQNASQAAEASTAVKKVSAKAAAKAAAAAAAVVDTDDEGAEVAAAPQRRRHRWRRGTVALRTIRREQKKSEKAALRAAPFERVVRAAAQKFSFNGGDAGDGNGGVRFTHKAIKALQEATEMHLYRQFVAAHAVTLYSGRLMLDVKDFALADFVRGDSHSFLLRGESVGE
jgi:histone H3/H4